MRNKPHRVMGINEYLFGVLNFVARELNDLSCCSGGEDAGFRLGSKMAETLNFNVLELCRVGR